MKKWIKIFGRKITNPRDSGFGELDLEKNPIPKPPLNQEEFFPWKFLNKTAGPGIYCSFPDQVEKDRISGYLLLEEVMFAVPGSQICIENRQLCIFRRGREISCRLVIVKEFRVFG